jgi:2-oxoisovalerate dehydrogenase E1 component
MAYIRQRDPLAALGRRLPAAERSALESENESLIADVHREALASPASSPSAAPLTILRPPREHPSAAHAPRAGNVRLQLNTALAELLRDEPRVILLGEDLHDPYGGAFKVTEGLSSAYPGRVISTPISEAAIVGTGIGLAMAGRLPVVEIMFADFITLAMDQIFNHAVKFPGMYPDTDVPLVVRTPSGGGRGYGPTHSQCPENLLAAVPGLTVVSPTHRHPVGAMLKSAVLRWPNPTMFMEHKLLYAERAEPGDYTAVEGHAGDHGLELFPTMVTSGASPDVTVVTYGGMLPYVEKLREELRDEELSMEIVAPALLNPLPKHQLVQHLLERQAVLVVEEAYSETGFGCAVGTTLLEAGFRGRFGRLSPPPVPIPAARSLESSVLPGRSHILSAIVRLLDI